MVMSNNAESDIRDEKIRNFEKQCEEQECLIHMLEDAYKQSLGETEQMETRLRQEEVKGLSLATNITDLENELRNIMT